MEPKEKAKKLLTYYYPYFEGVKSEYSIKFLCQECALITVEEVIAHSRNTAMVYDLSFDESTDYWQQVKRELQML
jgi:hypothetical protein